MNTKLLAGIGAVAIAVGAYIATQPSSSNTHISLPELDYVPADTAVFWGQLAPFEQSKYMTYLPKELRQIQQLEQITAAFRQQDNKNLDFLATLMEQYNLALTSPESMQQILGFGSSFRALAYTVGLLPTIRYELADPEALLTTIKMAAQDAEISFSDEQIKGVNITCYKLELAPSAELELITSVQGNWVTTTINTPFNTPEDLEVALGITKPAQALSETNKLENYTEQFGFDGSALAFINHIAIANGITANKNTAFTRMLDNALELSGDSTTLAAVRTPACQADYSDIASQWPATVMGVKAFNFTPEQVEIDADTIVVANNTEMLSTLAKLRGFIPEQQEQHSTMMSMAYGIDVAQLAPTLNTLWRQFTQADFQCAELVALQNQAKQNNPMAVAMMTGMANGIKGMSASVFAYTLEQNQQGEPEPKAFDALLSLSADDPMMLVNTAKGLAPMLADLEIPTDGSAVSISQYLPAPTPLDVDVKLALKGQHLVLFSGDTSTQVATKLAGQKLEKNGMVAFEIDMQAAMQPLMAMLAASGEPLPKEFAALSKQNMHLALSMDVSDKGLVLGSDIVLKKP